MGKQVEISLRGPRSMDPEDLDGDRSDESIDCLDINEKDAGLVDSDDALMHAEEEIDDSAQDGGVLGGRSGPATGGVLRLSDKNVWGRRTFWPFCDRLRTG